MRVLGIVLVGLSGLALAHSSSAQIFRWTDEAGRTHFTQTLEDVPPAHREAARARWDQSGERISITGVPPTPPRGGATPARSSSATDAPSAAREGRDLRAGRLLRDGARPGGRPETYWRGRYRKLATAVQTAERKVDVIAESSAAPGSVDYSRRARRDRERARWERSRALRANQRQRAEKLAKAQLALTDAREALDAFLEDARRADVPPGWVRD